MIFKMLKFQIIVFIILFLAGCGSSGGRYGISTEIVCGKYSRSFLILYFTRNEVIQSVENAVQKSIKNKDTDRFTILKFSDGSSTSLPDINPLQVRAECYFVEKGRRNMHLNPKH